MAEERRESFLRMLADLNRRHLVGVEDVSEVWLIRHADAYSGMALLGEGVVDPPLSPAGEEQARRLGQRLAAVPIDRVWASDLERARQTAQAVARPHGLPVSVDARLREVRTHWDEGGSGGPTGGDAYPFPEAAPEVVERMAAVLGEIVADLGRSGSARPRVAVVTHNAAIAIYVSSLLGLGWGQLRVMPGFTSVTVLLVKGEQIVVQSLADASHLVDARPAG